MTAEAGQWQRYDRRTLWLTALYLVGFVVLAGTPTTIALLYTDLPGWMLALIVGGGAVVLIGGGVLIDLVRWWYAEYRLTDQRVEYRFTLLFRTHKSVPRDRVRTVDTNATIAHRVLGLVRVKIGTGQQNMAGEVITLDPVSRATAEKLRTALLHRDATDEDDEQTLASMRWSWLRYAPISVTTPILGAAAFGAALQIADWFNLQGAAIDFVRGIFRDLPLPQLLGLLVAVGLLLGVIGSLGLWVELWWSYRLTRESGTLLVRRGLLTTRSLSVEERRLRGVELVEPLGARLSGAARVDAVASGLRTRIEEERNDPRTLLPVAPRAVAHAVAAAILREDITPTESVRLVAHPRVARRRRLVWAVSAVAGGSGLLALLGVLLTDVLLHLAWISAAVGLPIAVALALDAYRNLGHGITGRYLVARRGSVRRSTVALVRDGVIGWTVTSSPMQRRAGLVTLAATSAAGTGAYLIPDVDEGEGLAFADTAVPDVLAQFLVYDDAGVSSPAGTPPTSPS
ncbi:PH domain-containing protein [Actinokineospora sp.]|uniref:PH domain-containing protein n=1 Tax=Actinokineospora sp. TaxID=1872133 RepID=UPI0040381E28